MKVIFSLILLSTLTVACTATSTTPPISTAQPTSDVSIATQIVDPSSSEPVEKTQTPTQVPSNIPEPSPTNTITEPPPEIEDTPEEIEVVTVAFWESSPEEIFGKLKDGGIEGGVRPDLYEAYYEYDGTENPEIAQYFFEERIKMLEEFGKDVSNLTTPEAVRDAYLELLKEINGGRDKGEYIHAMLSLHEIDQFNENRRSIREGLNFEPPAVRGRVEPLSHDMEVEVGGIGAQLILTRGFHYKGYYYKDAEGIQMIPQSKVENNEFYMLSGVLEGVAYYPDKKGGFIALLDMNPPSSDVQKLIPIAFNNRTHDVFWSGIDYDNKQPPGAPYNLLSGDNQPQSVLDVWHGNTIATARREGLNPENLWGYIGEVVAGEMGQASQFFSAPFPPEVSRESPGDIESFIFIATILHAPNTQK
jgi:hypothetical protein